MSGELFPLDELLEPARPKRVRTSGIQTAQAAVRAQLEAWELQLGPAEYAVLIDIVGRMVEHERKRAARWLHRRAA